MSDNSKPMMMTSIPEPIAETPKSETMEAGRPSIEVDSVPTMSRPLSIPMPNTNFLDSASGIDAFRKPISLSPIKISPLSVSPTKLFPADLRNPIETEENLYDMKKWLMEKENIVTEAVAVQVSAPAENGKAATLGRSTSISSQPKFFSLDWSKPILPDEDLFDMKKWLVVEEDKAETHLPLTLVRRTSIKRSQYSDSYVAISAEDAENELEKIDETIEILATTLEATKVLDEIQMDGADSVQEKGSDIENLHTVIPSSEPNPGSEVTVLPNHPVPEPVYLNRDVEQPDSKTPAPWDDLPHEPEPAVFKSNSSMPYPATPVNRLTLVTAPTDKKPVKQGWSWMSKFKLFPKKEKTTPEDEEKFVYPQIEYPPNRLSPEQEKAVYELSHTKLAQVGRSLLQQVQISNLMLYILSVHSAVTIRGRGPQRKRRKGKRRRRQPLIDPSLIEKPTQKEEGSSSDSDEEDEDEEVKKIKARKGRVPAQKLVQFIPAPKPDVKENGDDEEDDIPLAMLQKTTRT
jgi:hypothetical protein